MPQFTVYGTVKVPVAIVVEADDADAAREKADEEWSGLSGYCGNGAMGGKLIGTAREDVWVESSEYVPEWREVSEGNDYA